MSIIAGLCNILDNDGEPGTGYNNQSDNHNCFYMEINGKYIASHNHCTVRKLTRRQLSSLFYSLISVFRLHNMTICSSSKNVQVAYAIATLQNVIVASSCYLRCHFTSLPSFLAEFGCTIQGKLLITF